MAGRLILSFGALLLIALVGAGVYIGSACPCERMPGVALWGDEVAEPVADWAFVNETGLCQLQVDDGLLPQSLNLNCMSTDGALYISCSRCDGKRWSTTALNHPSGRIRVEGQVYPVQLRRVEDAAELDRAWAARAEKLRGFGRTVSDARPDHWWTFNLSSAEG
jgi:hypothetical protein